MVALLPVCQNDIWRLGHNLFNPALVARVFLLISSGSDDNWAVTNGIYPENPLLPVSAGSAGTTSRCFIRATPLGIIKEGWPTVTMDVLSQQHDFSYWQMLFGKINGSMGEALRWPY